MAPISFDPAGTGKLRMPGLRQGIPALNALSISNTAATVGSAFTATISGQAPGSTLLLSGAGAAGLSISGATISGTPTTAGSVNLIETLAGAANSPRENSGLIAVGAPSNAITFNGDPLTFAGEYLTFGAAA